MEAETILELETTLDDCSPQVIGYVLERALALGALDAYTTPVQMKKSRPGVLLTLLARPELREPLLDLLLTETTTLGVRVRSSERMICERRTATVNT
ncbi:MAG: nickel insertion protein, partial [Terriglobales bacterium]